MIPNLIFLIYILGWAKALQYGIESSSYLIFVVMVLPLLAVITPLLIFGLRPPSNFLALSIKATSHASMPHILIGSLLSGCSIFYLVLKGSSSIVSLVAVLLVALGSCFTVYAHQHKVKPEVLL